MRIYDLVGNNQNHIYISIVRTRILLSLILSITAITARAQTLSLGLSSSLSSQGINLCLDHSLSGEMDIFNLGVDTYGLLSARTEQIGFCFTYSHQYVFSIVESEDFIARFHAGIGISTGYVHDHESGALLSEKLPLDKEMGIVAALACNAGMRFDFERPFAIELNFLAAPGIHIRKDSSTGFTNISFYKRGIYYALLPQISLYFIL